MEWIYKKWKSFFSFMEELFEKFPNENSKQETVNPILKSGKAD
jgi:hypothetical protein